MDSDLSSLSAELRDMSLGGEGTFLSSWVTRSFADQNSDSKPIRVSSQLWGINTALSLNRPKQKIPLRFLFNDDLNKRLIGAVTFVFRLLQNQDTDGK